MESHVLSIHLTSIEQNARALREHIGAPQHKEPGAPQRLEPAALAKVTTALLADLEIVRAELQDAP